MRILVVDDEGTVRKSCERILAEEGVEVVAATRGEEGLVLLAQEEFDAVFLDLMMPGVGGMETLSLLRRSHPALPVVVITGYATPEVEDDCRERGATAWLPKPFGPDELLRALEEAMGETR
jgi:CheY-like chemotaxis protein